jgi:hypothetical protein
MRDFLNILSNTFKRSKTALLLCVGLAFVICQFYSIIYDLYDSNDIDGVKIGLLIYDRTQFTDELKAYLSDDLDMTLVESDDYDALSVELVERHICGIVEVSGDEATATFLDDYENAAFVTAYLENFIRAYKVNPNSRANAIPLTVISAVEDDAAQLQKETFRESISTQLTFFFIIGMFVAFQISDDRTTGVYRRLKASGTRAVPYVAGICLVGVVCAFAQAALFLLYLKAFGVQIGVPIGPLLTLCLLFALFTVGYALLGAMMFKTRMSIVAVVVGGGSIFSILGGAYFPLDIAPAFMQKLAHIAPPYWFTTAIGDMQAGVNDWRLSAVVLALFAGLAYIISGVKFACEKG